MLCLELEMKTVKKTYEKPVINLSVCYDEFTYKGNRYTCRILNLPKIGSVRIGPYSLKEVLDKDLELISSKKEQHQHWCWDYLPDEDLVHRTDQEIINLLNEKQ